jgi:hypothetical protein
MFGASPKAQTAWINAKSNSGNQKEGNHPVAPVQNWPAELKE